MVDLLECTLYRLIDEKYQIFRHQRSQGHSCIISKDSGEKWALFVYDQISIYIALDQLVSLEKCD